MRKLIKRKIRAVTLGFFNFLSVILFCAGFSVVDAQAQESINTEDNSDAFSYSSGDRRDPFISLIDKSGDYKDNVPSAKEEMLDLIKTIEVDGILWDSVMPVAMINKEIHKVGDIINKLTVQKITDNTVTFAYYDLTYTITIIEKKDF